MPSILMPLPSEGFEPTEVAVPWKILRKAGVEVVFATLDGKPFARRFATTKSIQTDSRASTYPGATLPE